VDERRYALLAKSSGELLEKFLAAEKDPEIDHVGKTELPSVFFLKC
jgi:hypothetical protein